MPGLKKTFYVIFLPLFLTAKTALSQAPIITYTTPQTYTINVPIIPLAPTNNGGVVASGYTVSTFAGSGVAGHTDGVGTAATFNQPEFMTMDATGNIYTADYNDKVIRKITPAGVVSTFAGSGQFGMVDGIGTAASFAGPTGITIDSHGNLFVSEYQANVIRKITPAGVVSTFAGSGASGKVDGTGTAASFNWPYGIAIDANDNIYVAEAHNYLIRKITSAGVVSTFAGDGTLGANDGPALTAQFRGPTAVATDAAGNVYVSDGGNNSIRKINSSGIVSTIAGIGGPAALSGIHLSFVPWGLRADNQGNVYIADTHDHQIIKISPQQNTFSVIAGSLVAQPGNADGVGNSASFNQPRDLVFDILGNMYVCDYTNNLIRKLIPPGNYSIDKSLPAGLSFNTSTGIISGTPRVTSPATTYTITASNNSGSNSTTISIQVIVTTPVVPPPDISYQTPQTYTVNTQIASLTPTNKGGAVSSTDYTVSTLAGSGVMGYANGTGSTAMFSNPYYMAIDATGNIYLSENSNGVIRKITPTGVVTTFAGSPGPRAVVDGVGANAKFQFSVGIAADSHGNFFVCEGVVNVIRKITPTGVVTTFAGSGTRGKIDGVGTSASFYGPYGIAVDANDNIYVADRYNIVIRKITPAGVVTTFAGNGTVGTTDGAAQSAQFMDPTSVAADKFGNVYVVDGANIRKISPSGVVSTIPGRGIPLGIRADDAGTIYVTTLGNQILKITPSNTFTLVAGSPLELSGSANGSTSVATFFQPRDLVFDASDNIYVDDYANNMIRKLTPTGGYSIDKPLPAGLTFDTLTGIISGTPTITSPSTNYTITAGNDGGSSSTIVNITVSALPQVVITFPQPIVSSANSNNDITPTATSTNTQIPITYSSDNPAVAIITNGLIHIVAPGIVHITASQAGNANFIALNPVTVTITVSQQEIINFASIAVKNSCDADFNINATSNVSSFPITYTSSNTAVAIISAQGLIHIIAPGTTTIMASQIGDNVIYLSAQPVSQQLTVAALPAILPSVTLSASANNIYAGVPVTFTAMAANAGKTVAYQWQVNGSNTGTNSATYSSSVLKNGDVVICIITSNIACTVPVASNAIIVTIIPAPAIIIPNAFSPNGDGINDKWDIPELINYPSCLMSIYNRNGGLVFQSKGYTIPWDGIYNNNQLPASTYYYVLTLGQGIPNGKLSGYIAILR